eukprot:15365920-Ditylum_brightwellii.AAC.3
MLLILEYARCALSNMKHGCIYTIVKTRLCCHPYLGNKKFQATLFMCKTSPIIRDVLTYKLSQWMRLATGNMLSIHCDNLGHNLRLVLEEQVDIGWENFVKGRVSEWWGKSQEIFYNDVYSLSNYKKEQWTAQLTTGVWQIFYNVWKACNAHLHSPLGTDNKSYLNKCIRHAYGTLSHAMSWTDSLLFSTPLHDQLEISDMSKIAWLEAVKIAEHDFTVINKQSLCQHAITEMFQAQETEQIITNALLIIPATIADDWSQAEAWDGPNLI